MASSTSGSSTVPRNAGPQFIGYEVSAICSLLARPAILTGVFKDVLTRHFASEFYIENQELKHLIWQNSPETPILIESATRWDPRNTDTRPAVIIKRNAYSHQRLGLGGERRQLPPQDRTGNPHYTSFWAGSHTLFCIGGTGAQAELLATEVQRELHHFGPLLLAELMLHRFGVVEVGEISVLDEWRDSFVVPVNVGYVYEESWVIRTQAPTLKRVALSTLVDI
jgi:hypothetical protein